MLTIERDVVSTKEFVHAVMNSDDDGRWFPLVRRDVTKVPLATCDMLSMEIERSCRRYIEGLAIYDDVRDMVLYLSFRTVHQTLETLNSITNCINYFSPIEGFCRYTKFDIACSGSMKMITSINNVARRCITDQKFATTAMHVIFFNLRDADEGLRTIAIAMSNMLKWDAEVYRKLFKSKMKECTRLRDELRSQASCEKKVAMTGKLASEVCHVVDLFSRSLLELIACFTLYNDENMFAACCGCLLHPTEMVISEIDFWIRIINHNTPPIVNDHVMKEKK